MIAWRFRHNSMLHNILHSHYQLIRILPDQPQETRQFRWERSQLFILDKNNEQQTYKYVEPFCIKTLRNNLVFAGKSTKTPEEPEKESLIAFENTNWNLFSILASVPLRKSDSQNLTVFCIIFPRQRKGSENTCFRVMSNNQPQHLNPPSSVFFRLSAFCLSSLCGWLISVYSVLHWHCLIRTRRLICGINYNKPATFYPVLCTCSSFLKR